MKSKKENSKVFGQEEEDEEANEVVDYSMTIEYVETRSDKMKGRSNFEGRIVRVPADCKSDYDKLRKEGDARDVEIAKIEKLIEKFDMELVRRKVVKKIDKAMDELELEKRKGEANISQFEEIIQRLLKEHKQGKEKEEQDVFRYALKMYKEHLADLEQRDITSLKKQI